jgi:hypothetical protein
LTDLACNLTDCQGLLHIAANVFKIPEAARVTLLATNSRVKRPEPTAGRDAHGAAKHPAAAPSNPNGRAVRVASLKKR